MMRCDATQNVETDPAIDMPRQGQEHQHRDARHLPQRDADLVEERAEALEGPRKREQAEHL